MRATMSIGAETAFTHRGCALPAPRNLPVATKGAFELEISDTWDLHQPVDAYLCLLFPDVVSEVKFQ